MVPEGTRICKIDPNSLTPHLKPLSKWNPSWKIKHQTLGKVPQGSELPTREHCRWQGYKAPSSALSTVKTKGFPPSSKSVSKDSLRMLCPDGLQAQNCKLSKVGIPKEPEKKSSLALLQLPAEAHCPGLKARIFYCYLCVAKSCAQSCLTLRSSRLQHIRVPCPSLSPGVCSNSYPLSW